jgi:hypothetical protein
MLVGTGTRICVGMQDKTRRSVSSLPSSPWKFAPQIDIFGFVSFFSYVRSHRLMGRLLKTAAIDKKRAFEFK